MSSVKAKKAEAKAKQPEVKADQPELKLVQPEAQPAPVAAQPEQLSPVPEQAEAKPVPKTFSTVISIPAPRAEVSGWSFPEDVVANQWYVGIYFSDKTPYLVRWDKHLWRDNRGLPVAVPMRIKLVGEFPKPPKTPKKDAD